MKDFVQRESKALFLNLETKMMTNWVFGPRQNKLAVKSLIKPVNRDNFDKLFKSRMVQAAMSAIRVKIRNGLKPDLIVKKLEYYFDKVMREVTNETQFEAEYAHDKQVFNDFNFNVGRKLHILKVAVKVGNVVIEFLV